MEITCNLCGNKLSEYDKFCPVCGNIGRNLKITILENCSFNDSINGKIKEDKYKKPRVEFICGDDYSHRLEHIRAYL